MSKERRIGALLDAVALPEAVGARERTAARARELVRAPARRSTSISTPQRALLAACALVAAVGFAFTPPGRAVAEGVADLVGIGDPPSIDHSGAESVEPTNDEIVIGTGTTGDGQPFEIVAYEGQDQQRGYSFAGTCIALDWPDIPDWRGGTTCIDGPQRDPLPIPDISWEDDQSLGPAAEIVLSGLVGPQVDRVEVEYTNHAGERMHAQTTTAQLRGRLAERARTSERVGFFVGFLPDRDVGSGGLEAEVLSTVRVTAYNERGETLDTVDYGRVLSSPRERR